MQTIKRAEVYQFSGKVALTIEGAGKTVYIDRKLCIKLAEALKETAQAVERWEHTETMVVK